MIGGLDNIHYVLLKRGWPEKTVVLVFYLITALLSAVAVAFILLRMKI
jgi:UDP-N-acetylmuramyl pentapeptide phosphotransferase/UDP-N-acetylglucosamine-1-phosphate transferase